MAEAGHSITVVGHSLGAGAAALMSMMFKQRGISRVSCYAFATPNCVSLSLAERCAINLHDLETSKHAP